MCNSLNEIINKWHARFNSSSSVSWLVSLERLFSDAALRNTLATKRLQNCVEGWNKYPGTIRPLEVVEVVITIVSFFSGCLRTYFSVCLIFFTINTIKMSRKKLLWKPVIFPRRLGRVSHCIGYTKTDIADMCCLLSTVHSLLIKRRLS